MNIPVRVNTRPGAMSRLKADIAGCNLPENIQHRLDVALAELELWRNASVALCDYKSLREFMHDSNELIQAIGSTTERPMLCAAAAYRCVDMARKLTSMYTNMALGGIAVKDSPVKVRFCFDWNVFEVGTNKPAGKLNLLYNMEDFNKDIKELSLSSGTVAFWNLHFADAEQNMAGDFSVSVVEDEKDYVRGEVTVEVLRTMSADATRILEGVVAYTLLKGLNEQLLDLHFRSDIGQKSTYLYAQAVVESVCIEPQFQSGTDLGVVMDTLDMLNGGNYLDVRVLGAEVNNGPGTCIILTDKDCPNGAHLFFDMDGDYCP